MICTCMHSGPNLARLAHVDMHMYAHLNVHAPRLHATHIPRMVGVIQVCRARGGGGEGEHLGND